MRFRNFPYIIEPLLESNDNEISISWNLANIYFEA